jgi:penicillin-binding protein 1A
VGERADGRAARGAAELVTAARRRSRLWRYRRLLFLAALATFTALGGAVFVLARVPLPKELPQSETTLFTDVNGAPLASLDAGENRVAVTLDAVPPVVVDAVLAAEDKNFYRHLGIDPFGIVRAAWADVRGRSLQGGSTITQQYVKNTLLTTRERTVWRKLREATLAVKVEQQYDKDEILERYLNTIYFGRGAYGVQAASRSYFGKDVEQLGLAEASYLAGLIRAPERADASRHPDVARSRRDRTLEAMARTGAISAAERDHALTIPLRADEGGYVLDRQAQQTTVVMAHKGTEYFVEHVRQQLIVRYGEAATVSGGLRVRTSLDLGMQSMAYDAVAEVFDREDDPAAALVAVDDAGYVRAMVGGRGYGSAQPHARVNLALGAGGGGSGRHAGSTFKAFLLAAAVRDGYSVLSEFEAPPEVVLPGADDGRDYVVRNYEGSSFDGSMNLVDATVQSVNTVFVQAHVALGPDKVAATAADMGITSPLEPNASLVLGTEEVSVLEMAAAFSTLANEGTRISPVTILEVATADGTVLERAQPAVQQVLEPDVAAVVTHCLRDAVERGTGTGARIGQPVAGKTGTTQEYGDAWFVGYTRRLTAAVWVGHAEGSAVQMTNVRGRRVTGGSFPATIFRRFMEDATAGLETVPFRPARIRGRVLPPSSKVVLPTTTTTSTTTEPTEPTEPTTPTGPTEPTAP